MQKWATPYLLYTAKYYVFSGVKYYVCGVKYYVSGQIMGERACSSRSRCENARECDICARARQQKIAGVAEAIEQQHGPLTMTVIRPEQNTAAAIEAVRASFMRRALAPAGIWTVETGELFGGLHLNILSPAPREARWRGCQTYSELLRTTARDAAAYIAKRSGMPTVEQYAGRLYGSFGKVGEILATQQRVPVVQAAMLEVAMGGGSRSADAMQDKRVFRKVQDWSRLDASKPTFYNPEFPHECNPPLMMESGKAESTKEERAEIMKRHLSRVYEAIGRARA